MCIPSGFCDGYCDDEDEDERAPICGEDDGRRNHLDLGHSGLKTRTPSIDCSTLPRRRTECARVVFKVIIGLKAGRLSSIFQRGVPKNRFQYFFR